MRVYLIRHGDAERRAPRGEDRDRALTEQGRAQARYLAQRLPICHPAPSVVLSSGFARAWQTAEPIAEALGCEVVRAETLEEGHASATVSSLVGLTTGHADEGAVAFVGHEPTLGALLATLVSGLGCGSAAIKRGQAVVVEVDPAQPIGTGAVVTTIMLGF